MAVAQGPFLAVVLLLASFGHHCVSPLPTYADPCTCQIARLLNCSSSGLSLVPQHIRDSVTELDLSHNLLDNVTLDRPHRNLRAVWLGNNSITRLSLCIERNLGGRHARGRPLRGMRPWSRRGCVSWAPTLQLLSVERNRLEQLPEGLEGSESLQVLQLSFNRISTLRPGDLSRLQQLTQLHLQHNHITSLHPQMFQDLAKLQVLDLSYNKLTSLQPLMYLSLRKLGADVRLGGNRWQCDCSMRSLRRRLAYDSSRGLQTWSVVCASPSILSGRDVLQLEENDLNCFSTEKRPELHQDVTVYRGSEILLSCSAQDSTWWTPSGQARSVSRPQAGLHLSDLTEKDTGLYVCVSEENEVLSVFNLQISQIEGAKRKIRSLPETSRQTSIPNRAVQGRNQTVTQSRLTLAVCLSVFITFLIAFILGVLARPCIDILWRRVMKKKDSPETNSVATVEQRHNNAYDNEACSVGEEPEVVCVHRERRVTFSDIGDNSNVQYYDTVANEDQESINYDAVFECDAVKVEKDMHTSRDSGSENSFERRSQEETQGNGRDPSGITDVGHTHNIEYERIPDPDELEERRSMSSCSDSSLSDKVRNVDQMTQRDNTTPKSTQLAEESLQQRADIWKDREEEMPQASREGSEIPEFYSEPFADWSPHAKNRNRTDSDLWHQKEEEFEFSDSVRSVSERSSSVFGSFNDSKLTMVPTTNKQAKDNTSSSSSCDSGDEPTEYTVNPYKEEDIERNHNKLEATNVFPTHQIHGADYTYDTERRAVRPKHPFSSHSRDSHEEDYKVKKETDAGDGEDKSVCVSDELSSSRVQGAHDIRYKVVPMPRTKRHISTLNVTSNSQDTQVSSRPAAYSSSSSSESEIEVTKLKAEHNTGQVNEGIKTNEPEMLSTNMDVHFIPQLKTHFDINTPLPVTDSTSSDDSMDEATKHTKRQEQGDVTMTGLPMKVYQPESHDAITPQLPPQRHPTTIKRHLDNRAPSLPTGSSSSSESEDETMAQKQEKTRLQSQETAIHDSVKRRPAPDFEHIPQITRYKDVKTPKPPSESSFSSDSEADRAHNTVKQGSGIVLIAGLPFQEYQAGSHSPERQWPAIQLEHTRRIKRRLDIKAPSPPLESSSSSESEDETTNHVSKQGQWQMHTAMIPIAVSQTVRHGQQTQWPALDLEHISHVKRRLDFKAPTPDSDSSSSSDSDGETTGHIKKQEQRKTYMPTPSIKVSQAVSRGPQTQWPALDLEHTTRVKRRLDIKAPSPDSDSSSSSDSDGETTGHIKKQEQRKTYMPTPSIKVSQTVSRGPQTQWPALDLEHTTRVKRRLDIKAPSPDSDSSSSSDSDGETTGHINKQEQRETYMPTPTNKVSQTVSRGPQTQWPALDLEHTTRVKRRLDIKAPSPDSDSSSSSDSDGETTGHIKKQEQRKTYMPTPSIKVSQTVSRGPQTQWPALDLEHTTRVKRRLDIKAPSPDSDSSSSSDSDGETTGHIKKQEQRKTYTPTPSIKVSQTVSRGPQTQWPALDLEHTTRVKRRLDIKAPSPDSDSSSSSDSDGETTGHIKKQEQKKTYMPTPSIQVSQTVSRGPQTQWPALDLEHTTRVKRRLDIKAPSPDSDSSSSGDSEDESTGHLDKQKTGLLETAGRQRQNCDSDTQWPALDLEHTTRVKRRLDIKAPLPDSDSSSSSDTEDETGHIKKQEQRETYMPTPTNKVSQTVSRGPQTQWPALALEHTLRVKRHLDIKAPSPESVSSSSGDSEDGLTGHIDEQKTGMVDMAGPPLQEPQRENRDSDTQWPVLNLEHTSHIKRRLDIKAALSDSDSSSSSGSEDETVKNVSKQEQWQMHRPMIPITVSQTQWPALDLEQTSHVKRRLDIKAPSPDSDSSSSNDSEDETIGHIKKQGQRETYMPRPPVKISQTVSQGPQTQWPALNLEHTTRIKRHLDIKAPSPESDSSSSSDGDGETGRIEMQRRGRMDITEHPLQESQRENHDPDTQWPVLNLVHTTRVKRHLDVKAPSPGSNSSSSVDSDGETGHIEKKEQRETYMTRPPTKISQTASHDPQTQWPGLDLDLVTRIKRRLDIKAQSPASDSSSSSDSEGETHHTLNTVAPFRPSESCSSNSDNESRPSSHTVKHERDKDDVRITNHEEQTKLHEPSWNIPYINRRLDIKAPSPQPDPILSRVSPGFQQLESRFSGSDSEGEKGDHAKPGLGVSAISKTTEKKFFTSPETPVLHTSHSSKTDPSIKLEKYTVFRDDMGDRTSDNINTTPEINSELESRWATMNLGISRFRKHLKITSRSHEPPDLPSSPPPDLPSSSSSDKEAESKHRRTREKRREAVQGILQRITQKESLLTRESKSRDDNSGDSVERLRKDYSFPETEEQSKPDPILTSFDTPYSRRHVDIKVGENVPTVPPLHKLPDSSSSSENEDASTERLGQRWRGRPKLPVVTENQASQNHTSLNVAQNVVSQTESMEERIDYDTIDYSVPDLSLGVPRIKRRQVVKAPLSGPSNSPSSSSESESEVRGYSARQSRDESNVSRMTDTDSLITYKRLIFKASPQLSSSPSSPVDNTKQRHAGAEMGTVAQEGPSHTVGGQHASFAPMKFPSMRFDDVVRKRTEQFRDTTDVDLPSEIRWTGTGRQLSDFIISSPRTNTDVGSLTPQQEQFVMPELSSFDFSSLSSSETDDKIKQDRGEADGTLMYKYSTHSASSVSRASSRALDKFDDLTDGTNYILGAEDKQERKGLSALKAMSAERRKWDTQDKNIDEDVSPVVLVDDGLQVDTSFYSQNFEDIKPPAKQLQIQQDLFSTLVDERISTDLFYGVPRYRQHGVGSMRPPQVGLPPIPTQLPPLNDAETPAWRSTNSSVKQGLLSTRFYAQQSRKAEEPDPSLITSQNPAVPFDSSNDNISYV